MTTHIVEGEVVYSFDVTVANDPCPYWVVIEERQYDELAELKGVPPYYVWSVYRGGERYEAADPSQRAPRIEFAAAMAMAKIVNWEQL